MSQDPLNVALVGLGTVGSGVASLLIDQADRMQKRCGRPIELRRVLVRDASKVREADIHPALITTDVQTIIQDDEIDVVLQVMGGLSPAEEYMTAFLQAGKHVVTANKALICERGPELFQIAKANERCIAFEAAVAGGVPIIQAVGAALASNQIRSIEAILNGTSNFILSQMVSQNQSYSDALKLAQQKGYAEADPTMDVDGTDAAQKLVILTQLAFGSRIPLANFTRSGIDGLELTDLQFAKELGYAVKLLGTSRLVGEKLEMHVQPALVPEERLLARIDGAYNMIALEGDAVGKAWFSGPGAGAMPTASAVVSDLIDLAIGRMPLTFEHLDIWGESPAHEVLPPDDLTRRYYLRFSVEDRPHVFADITDVLGQHGISLASVIQHEVPEHGVPNGEEHPIVPLVIMTHRTEAGRLAKADADLDKLSCLRSPRVRIPVAD